MGGLEFYAWRLYDSPYPLAIHLQTATTNVDISTNVPEVCVGQSVNFTTSWGGPPPGAANTEWVHWHLPDKYVNEQWQDQKWIPTGEGTGFYISYGSVNYRKNPNLLEGWTTHCWYTNEPGGVCSVGTRLLMSNGQEVNVAASGQFIVYRPQATLDPASIYEQGVRIEATGTYPAAKITSGDVNFNVIVKSKDFTGEANWVQLVKRQTTADGLGLDMELRLNTFSSYWLDNDPFYNTVNGEAGKPPVNTPVAAGVDTIVTFGTAVAGNVGSGDRPSVGLYGSSFESVADDFETYLVFKPAGDGIWVTLGRVDWGWSGYAALDILTLKWELLTHANGLPGMSRTDESPVWMNIYSNSK